MMNKSSIDWALIENSAKEGFLKLYEDKQPGILWISETLIE